MIDSTSNPSVKALRALATAKARRERHEFLVEGVRVFEDALTAGKRPALCLYNTDLLSRTARGRVLIRQITRLQNDAAGVQTILEASPRALEAAADTVNPQGVVAAFPMLDWPSPPSVTGMPLTLVCDDVQDPGNLGTLLRTAEAAGVSGVWLTPRCVDIYSPKVVRAAMGAHFRLPYYAEQDWPEIATSLSTLGIADHIYATEADASQPYDAVDWTQPSAFIVSNEAHGLSEEAKALASGGSISIPMHGDAESLNVATAAAVILFEAARQRRVSELSI
jgi:TrmH family RNA methyltransferase